MDEITALRETAKALWAEYEAARKTRLAAPKPEQPALRKAELAAHKRAAAAFDAVVQAKQAAGLWPTYSFLDRHATDKAA